jgi:VIT1/CCC1 family predicted Fe2+/Mn2+ transporter
MSKKTLVTILGSLVVVLPFVGLPNAISTPVFVLCGLGIVYIARAGKKKKDEKRDEKVENSK